MKTRVELDPQVADFVRSLAPKPRRRLRESLRGLEEQKGDLQQLEGDLTGYARLRVGSYRVIVRLSPQLPRDLHLAGISLSALLQFACLPPHLLQFFCD